MCYHPKIFKYFLFVFNFSFFIFNIPLLHDRFFLLNITLSLLLIQGVFWLTFLNLKNLPPELPLYYFQPWGQAQLAPAQNFWLLTIFPLSILIVNSFLARFFYRKEKMVAQMFVVISTVVSFLCLLAAVTIMRRIGVPTPLDTF